MVADDGGRNVLELLSLNAFSFLAQKIHCEPKYLYFFVNC